MIQTAIVKKQQHKLSHEIQMDSKKEKRMRGAWKQFVLSLARYRLLHVKSPVSYTHLTLPTKLEV